MDNQNNNFNQQNNYGQPGMQYQQPQYQQPQYQQPQYQQPQQPGMQYQQPQYQQPPVQGPQKEYTAEDRRMANILCIVSLICMFVIPAVFTLIMGVVRDAEIVKNDALDKVTDLFIFIIGAAHIAAWVLMILVRVKYKHSTFGKVLMIVYLILLALAVIGVIVLIVSCISCLRDCNF